MYSLHTKIAKYSLLFFDLQKVDPFLLCTDAAMEMLPKRMAGGQKMYVTSAPQHAMHTLHYLMYTSQFTLQLTI